MNSYDLSRNFFNWTFDNPEKITPTHIAMYFFIIEQCNRLGWKEKFGLPTIMVKEAIGIKNFRTYSNTLNDLVEWGFIKMIEKSKNQFSSNIIAIVKNTKATTKATTKALDKALQKHSQKQGESIATINKQDNKEQETNNIYDHYPTKCPVKNRSLSKSSKDKEKIKRLLDTHDEDDLIKRIDFYVSDCKKNNVYLKNFSTFLNNLPEIPTEPQKPKQYQWKLTNSQTPNYIWRGTKEQYEREKLTYPNGIILVSDGN